MPTLLIVLLIFFIAPVPSRGTNIEFQIAKSGFVSLKIFDLLGREVATLVNEDMKPGSYERTFDAGAHASGMYLYRIQAGNFVQTKKLLLLR